jgi:hypothetical protein
MFLMPSFKIHRLRDTLYQQFRWAPHTPGAGQVRPKDYTQAGTVEAPSPYAAWTSLKDSGDALRVGDILEDESGRLSIYKYVGFEEARWIIPEAKAVADPAQTGAVPGAEPAGGEFQKS